MPSTGLHWNVLDETLIRWRRAGKSRTSLAAKAANSCGRLPLCARISATPGMLFWYSWRPLRCTMRGRANRGTTRKIGVQHCWHSHRMIPMAQPGV